MDLYIVDSNYSKVAAIDSFSSLIWTERYSASGEVELVVPETADNRALITEDIFLHMPASREIMLIDSISIEDHKIKATGNSLSDFLKNRLFRSTWQTTADSWALSNPSAGAAINGILRALFNPGTMLTGGTVLTSAQGTNEVFPKVSYSADLAGNAFQAAAQFGNLYDAIKQIADADQIGFSFYPPSVEDGTGNLLFTCYRGLDRTSSQSTNSVVIFDPAMDTLTGIKELRSKAGYKNVAWVWPNGATAQSQVGVAYAPGAQALTGFARRTLMVEASDVNAADYTAANLAIVLAQKGRDALANNNYVRMMDGTIVPQTAYVYGSEYGLGDVIELRGTTNISQKARVTEYIRSQDATGERAYPTLSVIV